MAYPQHSMAPLLLLSALSVATHAADLGEGRVYEAMHVTQPPTVDGKLTEPCWQQAAKTDEFTRVIRGPIAPQQTLFQVVYDDARLYIGVTCLEPKPQAIRATVTANDTATVMGDDAVELFLRPDLNAPDYYQFAANSVGAHYDAKAFDSSWNADWQVAASVGEGAWYLEGAISLASLGRFGVPGATWGFNLCRDRSAGGDTEWSAWSDTKGQGFHAPERFGTLVFGGAGGGVSRGLMIECARAAQVSIGLEARINDALKLVKEARLDRLDAKERQDIQARAKVAEASLQGLRDLLNAQSVMDLAAWLRVNSAMRKAADDLDDAAWDLRFATLLQEE